MIKTLAKKAMSIMPSAWHLEIRRYYYRRQIAKGKFFTDEPEYEILNALVSSGNWVIDIGANIGHYTKKLSELVGPCGRVIAIEPVPDTFMLLSSNTQQFRYQNITLLNLAVSDKSSVVSMNIPRYDNGMRNYYEAHLVEGDGILNVMAIPLDFIQFAHPVSLVKMDAEGHELKVLEGMRILLKRDNPILIIETFSKTVEDYLGDLGYVPERLNCSPNIIFRPRK